MAPRILLADDSPHAQRMGERILREEGFEVVTVTDGSTVLHRLDDVRPDVLLLDAFLPDRSGYEICRFVKASAQHRHAGVILVAGLLEPVSDDEASAAGADGVLKKPFEASAVMAAVRPLVEKSQAARANAAQAAGADAAVNATPEPEPVTEPVADTEPVATPQVAAVATAVAAAASASALDAPLEADPVERRFTVVERAITPEAPSAPVVESIDREIVRAAVTVALERSFPALVDEITRKVLESLPPSGDAGASNES